MEKKQLDFSAPLLSVRRFPSTPASTNGDSRKLDRWNSHPLEQLDQELGEVTKQAAIPFMWEQIPGRAKDGHNAQPLPSEEPSNELPQGRPWHVTKQGFEEVSNDKKMFRAHFKEPTMNDNATSLECLKEGANVKGDSDFECGNDEYSDALDILSPTESFSCNFSLNGFSGCDGADVRSSLADQQTRDFIMRRFLPAAKATAVETPEYVSRKLAVALEKPRKDKKLVSGKRRPLLEHYLSNIIRHSDPCMDVEIEGYIDDHDDSDKRPSKAFVLLGQFCLRNSLCLLNPVRGIKMRRRTPITSATADSRLTRISYSGHQNQIFIKHSWDGVYEKTQDSAVQSHGMPGIENKLIGESNWSTHSRDLHRTDELFPYRCPKGGAISPWKNSVPRSPCYEGVGFLGGPKQVENVKPKNLKLCSKDSNKFQDMQRYKQGPGSVCPTLEKLLYIDSESIAEPNSSEGSEAFKLLMDHIETGQRTETESCVQDIRCLNISEGCNILKHKAPASIKANLSPSIHTSDIKFQADRLDRLSLRSLNQDPRSLGYSKVHTNEHLEVKKEDSPEVDGHENCNVDSLKSPLPPPLPKSPSESWLCRALPSISSHNSFSYSHFDTQFRSKKQGPKISSAVTKWESIVKASNVRGDYVRYSEELLPPMPHIPRLRS